MRNILAIADKELRSYFSSPIAYILIGFFLLPFGVFFYLYLDAFVKQSMQMAQFGGAMNINQNVIRYVLQNASVIILFIMPMITMRTYSEEKRSGTIELLLTSPVTDVEIILGKFFGALGLYAAMLAVTLLYMAILFVYGNPEWRPLVAGYLGPAADGRRVRVARAAHLEHDEQPDRRRHRHVRGVPAVLDHRLVRRHAPGRRSARSPRGSRSPSTSTISRRASSTPNTCSIT